jgi:hypothetical protein
MCSLLKTPPWLAKLRCLYSMITGGCPAEPIVRLGLPERRVASPLPGCGSAPARRPGQGRLQSASTMFARNRYGRSLRRRSVAAEPRPVPLRPERPSVSLCGRTWPGQTAWRARRQTLHDRMLPRSELLGVLLTHPADDGECSQLRLRSETPFRAKRDGGAYLPTEHTARNIVARFAEEDRTSR